MILCEFLEEAYPDAKPSLQPSDPLERAYGRIWIDYIAKSIIPPFFRLIQGQTAEKQKEAQDDYVKALNTFTDKIRGPYFLGDTFTLVDVCIAPWIMREYIAMDYRGYTRELVGEKWKAYAELLSNRETVRKTQSVSLFYLHW